jgi:D-methionine transport system substrate-binding protein
MKKSRTAVLTAAALGLALAVTGCAPAAQSTTQKNDAAPQVLKVAAVQAPMTDVVEAAGKAIKGDYKVELVKVGDYVTANTILNSGDVYANFSQHIPYMESFNKGNDAHLVGVQPVYNFVIAFYSKTLKDIADLPENAKIAIPDDPSNTGRALKLLAAHDVIALDPEVDPYDATVKDVVKNPKNVQFLQVPIASLNAAYEEADLVFQWPSHIKALGLTPQKDGLITELDDRFALNLVVQKKDADSAATAALKKAFTSDDVRKVLEGNGTIQSAW